MAANLNTSVSVLYLYLQKADGVITNGQLVYASVRARERNGGNFAPAGVLATTLLVDFMQTRTRYSMVDTYST